MNSTEDMRTKNIKKFIRLWHPDKFSDIVEKIEEKERKMVSERALELTKSLTQKLKKGYQ